ncbi:MAG TPA: class I SAM-dependent methyltransferase [Acidimicrobiales bacterium]|nr:class I SAM-dependent methyltransferase [Acidimicrobiales bacterium]
MSADVAFVTDAHTASAAIAAGLELGLHDHLAEPLAVDALARRCGASPRGIEVLLEAYRTLGLVDIDSAGRWRAGDALGATAFFDVGDLVETVRTGRPAVRGDRSADAGAFYPGVVERLARWHSASAELAARALASPSLRILDAGAGGAGWSRAIVAREESCRVVAVDLPEVVATTSALICAAGVADNFGVVAGDLFTLDPSALGAPFDLVLAANLFHLFDRERASVLLTRLSGLLAPGGRLVAIDAIPTGSGDADDRRARLYGVHLLLRTGTGGVWTFDDYVAWMASCGLVDVERVDIAADSPMSMVIGVKR